MDTVYFGGGTPSYYGAKRLRELLAEVTKRFQVEKDAEITAEANPDSVDLKGLRMLRRAGFNRLSLGMQSADQGELAAVHRPHTPEQTDQAVEAARKAGFDNLSLDLIYGLPGQTEESWQATVEARPGPGARAPVLLRAEGGGGHPPGPPGGGGGGAARRRSAGRPVPVDGGPAGAGGLWQYEISNFAKPGFASRHNLRYWLTRPYIGFGPGAHSDFGGRRYSFVRDLDAYIRGCWRGATSSTAPS